MMLPRGLYAITSQAICRDDAILLDAVAAAIAGGAAMIQYRDKPADAATRVRRARALLELCRTRGVPLIVNDDLELAVTIGADGVHLGAADPPLAEARAALGAGTILGATCSNAAARVDAAQALGADYVALGRFFPSKTKPEAPPASMELLAAVRGRYPALPVCVIGGLTPDNAAPLVAHGAQLVAAVEGVFGAADIESAARAYARLF